MLPSSLTCKMLALAAAVSSIFLQSVLGIPYHASSGYKIERRSIHKAMTDKEIRRTFGSKDADQVPDYDMFSLSETSRTRREANDETLMSFQAFGKQFDMLMKDNTDIAKRNLVIEYHNGDGTVKRVTGAHHRHSLGRLADDQDSVVALSHQDGISGVINTRQETYVLQPIPSRLRQADAGGHDHIVYKASALKDDDGSSQAQASCGVKDVNDRRSPVNVHRQKRATGTAQKKRTMELMVAGDKSTVEFHGKDFLPTYLLAVANIAAGLYQSTSLSYKLTIAVTRVVIFEQDTFNSTDSVSNLLSRWHTWVKADSLTMNNDDTNPLYVDNAVLLSRSACGEGCGLAGLAYSGTCSTSAQSVNNDKGILTALTMAHELGHNLQLTHDGGSDSCKDGHNIMSTSLATGPTAFAWSSCSSAELDTVLSDDVASSCFDDQPTEVLNNLDFQLYGQYYSSDKQCAMSFGDRYTHCSDYTGSCASLVCKVPDVQSCVVSAHPLAHGTPCGRRKWCIYGECIPDGTTDPVVNGGWSEWSSYTTCTRTCGLGAQHRTRTCTNPAPSETGQVCAGDTIGEYKTCQIAECPAGTASFRQQQCTAKLPGSESYVEANNPCHLYCGSGGAGNFYNTAADGTNCYSGQQQSICIRGECKTVGCDSQLESGMVTDRCNVCGGDGSSCSKFTGSSDLPYSALADVSVTSIPVGSKNIIVKESAATMNFLGIKVGSSVSFLIALPSYSATAYIGNAKMVYEMEAISYADKITITGTVEQVIHLYVSNKYNGVCLGITWEYYMDEPSAAPELEWTTTDWETCSKTCATGSQIRSVSCRRKDDLTSVSVSLCDASTKPASSQACNEDLCPAEWNVGEFAECSKSCGGGIKTRIISCCQKSADGTCISAGADALCSGAAPTDLPQADCNVESCPPRYETGPWSECSKSCGGGMETRVITCNRINATGHDHVTVQLECTNLPVPIVTRECNLDIACGEWTIAYNTCSVSCGGGQQSPFVDCQIAGATVPQSLCSHETPPNIADYSPRGCNMELCNSFIWNARDGQCSVSCGTGTSPSIIECKQTIDDTVVADASCDAATKPAPSSKSCSEGECPIVYIWQQSDGPCSVSCGLGTKATIVTCQRESDSQTVIDTLCDVATKPNGDDTACQLEDCPITYDWRVSHSTECSVTCGTGVYGVTEECLRSSDKAVVDNAKCDPASKPLIDVSPCDMGVCPASYSYVMSYSVCSLSCGGGTKSTVYKCTRDTDSMEAADLYCSALTKPESTTLACNTNPCPGNYFWKENQGKCIPTCGAGYKLQVLHCTDSSTHEEANSSYCAGIPFPPQQACQAEQRSCEPVLSTARTPPFYYLGCYKESASRRRLPIFLKQYRRFSRRSIRATHARCAEAAFNRGMAFFSLSSSGKCYGATASAKDQYYKLGSSSRCLQNVAHANSISVNHFGSPLVVDRLPPLIALGCYNDITRPYATLIGDFRPEIDWADMYKTIRRCGRASRRWGRQMFGIEFYGECWTSATANAVLDYRRDGRAQNCYMGTGGVGSYYVYGFGAAANAP